MTTPSETALSAECISCDEPSHDIDYHDHHYHALDKTIYIGPVHAIRSQPAAEGLRERIDALTSPARYENDRNGNWWTTDMEYGWDEAIAAVLAVLAATEPAGDERWFAARSRPATASLREAARQFVDCELCSDATGTLCASHRLALRAAEDVR